ncbi:DUF624 domain-containing protein [Amphibacillus sp. Q70]|uniref:DUF624 domain-containing protein n=1 Tax=Amphibacillus sp. Q70 TaxID=3453416 RepID=UPI003F84C62F
MQKIFSLNGGVYAALARLFDLMVLSGLMIMTMLPIVTIGTALSAAYAVQFEEIERVDRSIPHTYLLKFKELWLKSSLLLFIHTLMIAILALVIGFVPIGIFQFPLLILLAVVILTGQMFYPVLATGVQSVKRIMALSFGIVLKYTGITALAFLMSISMLLVPIFLPKLIFLWFVLGCSIPIFMNTKLFIRPFIRFNLLSDKEETDENS